MLKCWLNVGFALLVLMPMASSAAIDAYPFPNEELQERYNALIDELRCPQCLNTNLAGSDAMIAQDLRREVHRLLLEGKSDDEILTFMYERYGDFILYKPRFTSRTWVLWLSPVLLMLIAVGMFVWIMRTPRAEAGLSDSEDARVEELLRQVNEK